MKIYLSGPMRGIPEDNHPAFNAAASRLRLMGHQVYNPAEEEAGDTIRKYFNDDCRYICLESKAIVMLAGWEHSKGACGELAIAHAVSTPEDPIQIFIYKDEDPWLFPRKLKHVRISLSPLECSTTSPTLSRKLPASLKPGTSSTIRARRSIGTRARARITPTP